MKNNSYPHAWCRAPLCFLPSALLALALAMLPGRSSAQTCTNLLPNPSFEAQNVSQLSGYQGNVYSQFQSFNTDELTGWQSPKNLHASYLSTNAPSGSTSNPSSPSSVFPYFPLQPHTGNGMLGLTGYSPYGYADYATMRSGPLTLTAGDYHASFWVYCPPANGVFNKMGMNLTTANPLSSSSVITYQRSTTSIESSSYVTQPSWQKVDGVITISTPGQYYVNIGNFSYSDFINNPNFIYNPSSGALPDRSFYFIDDVELTLDSNSTPDVPQIALDPENPNNSCTDNSLYYIITNFDPALKYTINVTSFGSNPLPRYRGAGTSTPNYKFRIKGGQGITEAYFTVTAENSCGTAVTLDEQYASFVFPGCQSRTVSSTSTIYTLSPNPATGEVLIQATSTKGNEETRGSAFNNIQVYDSYGKLRLEQAGTGASAVRLRIHKLPTGLYTVCVLNGKEVVSRQRLQVE